LNCFVFSKYCIPCNIFLFVEVLGNIKAHS
jgi:hypothetical protein